MSSPSRYKIPIVDLRAQYAKIHSEIESGHRRVLESQQFILGPAVSRFEKQMATYLQCRFAIGVASGSDALLLALRALEIGPGDGVIVTPFTFFSTVSAITRLGATPLFIDIDDRSYLISARAVEAFLSARVQVQDGRAIESRTGLRVKALLPVHLFGGCCDMGELTGLAEKYRLQIVEDVAQACGARIAADGQAKFAGTLGSFGCFSFFPTKTLGGFGDGGLVATNSSELADKIKTLRVHGESTKYHHQVTGINSRLDSIQAAALAAKQRYLDNWCGLRIERARIYNGLLTDTGLVGEQIVSIPAVPPDGSHVFNSYVVRVQRRDELKQFLAQQGIQTEIYYPLPLHLQACFVGLGYKRGDFPKAELASAQVLALPIYPELTRDQQETIVQKIQDFYQD